MLEPPGSVWGGLLCHFGANHVETAVSPEAQCFGGGIDSTAQSFPPPKEGAQQLSLT